MRFDKARIAMAAAALCAVLLPTTALAGWFSDDTQEVKLGDLLKDAAKYKDETVRMTLYFNAVGDEFNPYYTQFHRAGYGNFSAWPMDARLYTKRDFQRCYPHFYVRRKSNTWKDVQKIDRFDAVEVKVHVTHVFQGRPYVEVLEIDTVNEGMDDDEIKAAIQAHAHFLAGHYDRAESLYRRALTNDAPPLVRADLNRRLGDVRFMAKDYSDAKASYQRALRDAPDSEVLKRDIAACEQAYGRRNGNQQAQIEPTKQIAHYLEPVLPDMHSTVDLIIAALEDPAKAEQAEQQENLALARRSVHGMGDARVVTVSESETAEEPKQDERVAAADAGEEGVDESEEAMAAEEARAAAEAKAAEEARAAEEAAAAKAAEEARMAAEAKAAEEAAAAKAAEEARMAAEAKAAEEAAAAKAAEEARMAAEAKAAEEAAAAKAAEEARMAAEAKAAEEAKVEEPMGEEPVVEAKSAEEKAAEDAANLEAPTVEPVALDESNPRVFKVGNTLQLLPRLPFYGCATVDYEQFRAVVEEIMDTEDDLVVDGFETEEMAAEPAEAAPEGEVEEVEDANEMTEEPKVEEPKSAEPTIEEPGQMGDG